MGRVSVSVAAEAKPTTLGARVRRVRASLGPYFYLLPAFAVLGVFAYAPTFYVFYISLFKWNALIHGAQPFIGLGNYQFLLSDPNFIQAFRTSLTYVVVTVPLSLFLSLFIAMLLMSNIRARSWWRLAVFTPFITPMVATTTIWYWMFDYYHGFFNQVLGVFHLQPVDWLGNPHLALGSIIAYTVWKGLGFNVVLFMAGLANMPPQLAEAARVDGANAWQIFRHITWPMLRPITLVVLLLSTIEAFKMFQPVFLFEGPGGGPLNAARTLGLYLYYQAFAGSAQDGLGAAIAVFIFLLVFTIAAIQLGVTGRFARD